MSNVTMQKLWEAAQEFVKDTGNLVDMRKALVAHDADEKKASAPKQARKTAAQKKEEVSA